MAISHRNICTAVSSLLLLISTSSAFAWEEVAPTEVSEAAEFTEEFDSDSKTSAEGECPLSGIKLFIGKRDLHLFMCAEVSYHCPDKQIVSDIAFGAASTADQKDCETRPRPKHVVPFNDTLQGYCDKNPLRCLTHINTIGTKYDEVCIVDLFIAPVIGAPCRNAVESFVDLLKKDAAQFGW